MGLRDTTCGRHLQMLPSQNTRPLQPPRNLIYIYGFNHKTGTTGRAKITANKYFSALLEKYIHPQHQGSSSDLLFPNRDGWPLDHLSWHVEKEARYCPASHSHCHSTCSCHCCSRMHSGREKCCGHSNVPLTEDTALKKGKKEVVEGYRVMEGIRRGGGETTSKWS